MELSDNQFVERKALVDEIIKYIVDKDVDKAAGLLTDYQEDLGDDLLKRLEQSPHMLTLAEVFVEAKDFRRAAPIYESNERFEEAAIYYDSSRNFAKAAELYRKTGNDQMAAETLEKANRFLEAADIFVKMKDIERAAIDYAQGGAYFDAGKCFLASKKIKRALHQFQQVTSQDRRYVEAVLIVGKILHEGGHSHLARQKFLAVLKHHKGDPQYTPVQFELARLYYDLKEFSSARKALEEIIRMDPDHKSAAAMLEEIREIPEQEQPEIIEESIASVESSDESDLISLMDGFEFLRDSPLFDSLALEEIKLIFEICENKIFAKNEIIIEQGIPGWGLYIIKSGSVLLQLEEGGQLKDLHKLGPGSYVGEMSLIDNSVTSAKVIAVEKCDALAINRKRFNDLLNSHDQIKIKILQTFLRILGERLRKTTAELARYKP